MNPAVSLFFPSSLFISLSHRSLEKGGKERRTCETRGKRGRGGEEGRQYALAAPVFAHLHTQIVLLSGEKGGGKSRGEKRGREGEEGNGLKVCCLLLFFPFPTIPARQAELFYAIRCRGGKKDKPMREKGRGEKEEVGEGIRLLLLNGFSALIRVTWKGEGS